MHGLFYVFQTGVVSAKIYFFATITPFTGVRPEIFKEGRF